MCRMWWIKKKKQSKKSIFTDILKKRKHGCSLKPAGGNMERQYQIYYTTNFQVVCTAYKDSVLLTDLVPKTLAVQTAGWNMVRHTFALLHLRGLR